MFILHEARVSAPGPHTLNPFNLADHVRRGEDLGEAKGQGRAGHLLNLCRR